MSSKLEKYLREKNKVRSVNNDHDIELKFREAFKEIYELKNYMKELESIKENINEIKESLNVRLDNGKKDIRESEKNLSDLEYATMLSDDDGLKKQNTNKIINNNIGSGIDLGHSAQLLE